MELMVYQEVQAPLEKGVSKGSKYVTVIVSTYYLSILSSNQAVT